MSARTAILAATAVLAALVFLLARDEEPSAQLRALRADPLAAYVPRGGTLVDTRSQNEGSSLGKPVSARYTRLFQLASGASGRALAEARAAATAAGWTPLPPSRAFPNVFVADRRLSNGRAQLAVTLFGDARLLPDDVDPPALQISLRHLGP